MPEFTCVCGSIVRGDDRDSLIVASRRHAHEKHADFPLTDQNIADFVDAALRMGPPRPRVEEIETLEIQPLTPDRQDDLLRFFDYEAFADNPAWAACYCQFFYLPDNDGWQDRSAAANRAGICERVPAGEMTGYLAYVNGEPAGWCNAGPRTLYPRLDIEMEGRAEDASRTGSIVCFVIAPPYRRHGLARRLLDAAVEGFTNQGLSIAEAYPLRDTDGDGAAFRGPVSIFESAGFRPHRELERQTVMRRALTSRPPLPLSRERGSAE